MAQAHQIDKFCVSLRSRLAEIDERMGALKVKLGGEAHQARQELQEQLEKLRERLEHQRGNVSAARVKVRHWIEEKERATNEIIAEWKAKRETGKLESRAEDAELYANAATDIALASVEEAQIAALEAALAHLDADAVQSKQLK
jgi:DNA primase large subunit